MTNEPIDPDILARLAEATAALRREVTGRLAAELPPDDAPLTPVWTDLVERLAAIEHEARAGGWSLPELLLGIDPPYSETAAAFVEASRQFLLAEQARIRGDTA